MEESNTMNCIALQQNILEKSMIVGQGFLEGALATPEKTNTGLRVYINGKHIIPVLREMNLKEEFCFAKVHHPYALIGMPDSSGELIYIFRVCEEACMILIGLHIDEEFNGSSEIVWDILSIALQSENGNLLSKYDHHTIISSLIKNHFDRLFSNFDTIDELDDWNLEGVIYVDLVHLYFETQKNG